MGSPRKAGKGKAKVQVYVPAELPELAAFSLRLAVVGKLLADARAIVLHREFSDLI